jgi:hypothetical protein
MGSASLTHPTGCFWLLGHGFVSWWGRVSGLDGAVRHAGVELVIYEDGLIR